MKIAIITHVGDVYPPTHGSARRIWSFARNLAKNSNEVVIINPSAITNQTKEIEGVKITSVYLKNTLPLGIFKYNRIELFKKFLELEKQYHFDIVQYEYPQIFPIVSLTKIYGKPIVLDMHGVEADFILSVAQINPTQSVAIQALALATRKIESIAVRSSQLIFTCSQVDAERLRELYKLPRGKLKNIPNCVDDDFFEKVEPKKFNRPTVLFLGNFNHLPNCYAAKLLINKIMPRVRNKRPEANLVIVGRNPPSWLKAAQDIEVIGQVDDVRPYIAAAKVCVAPIYHGSGTRLKILEYMAMGKPVVSAAKGAEGIEIKDGEHILIRDSMQAIADAIIELLDNSEKANYIGERGQSLIKEKYSWDACTKIAIVSFKRLLPNAGEK